MMFLPIVSKRRLTLDEFRAEASMYNKFLYLAKAMAYSS
jgi:hypothetical protein